MTDTDSELVERLRNIASNEEYLEDEETLIEAVDRLAQLEREAVEAEARESNLHDDAYYEVGGGPHLWRVRAQAAESRLEAAGLDWYCGAVSPGSFQPVPSWSELKAERDSLAAKLKVAEEHYGNLLVMLAELHPDDRCRAFVSALEYYNNAHPEAAIEGTQG